MANPLDVISLEQAKEFLVIDFDDRDDEITDCINSAVDYVETYTNVMLYQRQKTYTLINHCLEIYDAPIGFLSTDIKTVQNILSVTVSGTLNQEVLALVGYVSNSDIPGKLLMACKKLITYFFENRDLYNADIPYDVQLLLNPARRSATL